MRASSSARDEDLALSGRHGPIQVAPRPAALRGTSTRRPDVNGIGTRVADAEGLAVEVHVRGHVQATALDALRDGCGRVVGGPASHAEPVTIPPPA